MPSHGEAKRRGACVICGTETISIDEEFGAYVCVTICSVIYFEENGCDGS